MSDNPFIDIGASIAEEPVEDTGEDTSLDLPRGYMSVSQVNLYYQCGWKYYLSYVKDMPRTSTVATATGKSVHALVENALKDVMQGKGLRPLEQAMDEAATVVSSELSEVEDLTDPDTGSEKDESHWVDGVRKIYRTWHSLRAPHIVPLAVEKKFEVVLNGVPTVGVIDLIDGKSGKTVVDLKVTKRKKSLKDAQNSLQLALYSHVEGTSDAGFDNIVKKAVPEFHATRVVFTPKEGKWAATLVRDAADCISAGVFPKTSPDNWWCSERFCDHWSNCRGK